MRRLLLPLLLGLASNGCAHEVPSARAPDRAFMPWITPTGYAWPPRTISKNDRMHPSQRALERSKTDPITSLHRPPLPSDTLIPGGSECIDRLREAGVRFEILESERGVQTPVMVRGPIGGVEFWSNAGPMVVDCRMALALSRVSPEFLALGIRRARFSGAYVYRTTSKTGRLSLHAYGLALDMHDIETTEGALSVSKDFARGRSDGCAEEAPVLNRLACRLKAQGLFRELLSPDYDADHQDHIHLGLAPLPSADPLPEVKNTPHDSGERDTLTATDSRELAQSAKPKYRRSTEPVKPARR